MAIKFNFGGKTVIEPGSYARIIGGSAAVPPVAAFGKVMLIDTGSNEGFGIGAGINGELSNGKSTIVEFSDPTDFKEFVRGGLFYDLADYLFRPSANGQGVDSIKYVRAGTTTAASKATTVSANAFVTKTGTITTNTSTDAVTGVGTKFTEELSVGDTIADDATDTAIGVVLSITDDLNLVLAANAASTHAGVAYSAQFSQPQGGTFTIKTVNEGVGANGIIYNGDLIKGYAWKLETGILDTSKYRFVFYGGNFRGVNAASKSFSTAKWAVGTTYAANAEVYYNGLVWKSLQAANTGQAPDASPSWWSIVDTVDNYGGNKPSQTGSVALVSSPELSTLVELFDWMESNSTFKAYFKLTAKTVNGEGKIDDGDLTALSSFQTFAGGTTTYSSADFDAVLDNITEEDNSFFLMDDWGAAAKNAKNTKLLSHIANDAEFAKLVVIGGGHDASEFKGDTGSLGIAKYFDSSKLICVHGGINVAGFSGGLKELPSIYHAALFLGRTAGLEPQVPSTWKDINIISPVHELSKKERELALMGGVVHQRYVDGKGWVINQSINTLQRNEQLFLTSGDSYEVSIERIRMQLNKELILNSRVIFIGGNLNTASAEDVKTFTEGYLYSRTARPNLDNLIISFRDVKVTLSGDAWKIDYGFVPNSPINKMFFTGVMLDANISI